MNACPSLFSIFTMSYVFWRGDNVRGEGMSVLAWLLIEAVLGELIYEWETGKKIQ